MRKSKLCSVVTVVVVAVVVEVVVCWRVWCVQLPIDVIVSCQFVKQLQLSTVDCHCHKITCHVSRVRVTCHVSRVTNEHHDGMTGLMNEEKGSIHLIPCPDAVDVLDILVLVIVVLGCHVEFWWCIINGCTPVRRYVNLGSGVARVLVPWFLSLAICISSFHHERFPVARRRHQSLFLAASRVPPL